MRALLFAYYFPPMGGIGSLRALGLARHLPDSGVETAVVAPRTGTYGRDPSILVPAGLRVVRTGSLEPAVLLGRADRVPALPAAGAAGAARRPGGGPRRLLGGLLRRLTQIPDGNVGWVPAAVRAGIRTARDFRPDVVLSSSPPLSAHLAAGFVARRIRRPHVADFRDFFDTQHLFGGIRERVDVRIEDGIFRRLAGVVAATEGVLADLRPRTAAPALVLPNGFDEEDFAGPAPAAAEEGPFTLVHVGSSYAAARDPAAFFGAIADLRAAGTPVRLSFLGAPDPALVRAVAAAGVADLVSFGGFATHAEAVLAMRAAPALLLFVWGREGKIDRGILAGKTYEYLRSGRPILVVGPADGETARAVREAGGGVQREIDDRAGIAAAVADLAAGRRPPPPDPAVLARRSRAAGASRLAAFLAEMVVSRG